MITKSTCTRRFQMCVGHQLLDHEGACKNIHGHNVTIEVTVESINGLDKVGRIIDFSIIKKLVGDWLNENWDHSFIVNSNDTNTIEFLKKTNNKHWVMTNNNPTSENMATFLLEYCNDTILREYNVRVTHVRFYETDNCWTDAYYTFQSLDNPKNSNISKDEYYCGENTFGISSIFDISTIDRSSFSFQPLENE